VNFTKNKIVTGRVRRSRVHVVLQYVVVCWEGSVGRFTKILIPTRMNDMGNVDWRSEYVL